jgi:formylglycine-generating enzyme required for sulfatase activity
MYGNVAEWCNDFYDEGYYSEAPAVDPHGPPEGASEKFVLRGGAYNSGEEALRSAARRAEYPGQFDGCIGGDHLGFRCVRNAPAEEAPR